jgi:hypothetical protein
MSSTGTADGMSLLSASAPVDKKTSVSVNMATTTTLRRYLNHSRVLTFNYAGFGQRSLSGQHFELCLRGGSGLLSGWRGFFLRRRCRGFIPLPGQVRRFPAEYTSRLSIKHDYHIKYYSGRFNTYKLDRTTVTVGAPRILVMSTSPASAGASYCASTATASSAAAAGSVLSCAAGGWRSICAKSSSTVGAGLRLPAASPTVSHSPSSP